MPDEIAIEVISHKKNKAINGWFFYGFDFSNFH